MLNVEYLTDRNGEPRAVVVPTELWRQLFPQGTDISVEALTEGLEDYCLSKAMDEAHDSPLLNRDQALAYLEE